MDNARCHRKTAREIESRQTDKTDGQTEKKVQDSRTWVEDKHTEGRRREISVDYVSGLILQAQVVKRLVVKKEASASDGRMMANALTSPLSESQNLRSWKIRHVPLPTAPVDVEILFL